MTEQTERVDLSTPDLAAANRDALAALFPGVLADGVLDATRLGELLDVPVTAPTDGRERFGLMWAGKQEAVRSLLTPSRGTLVPDMERSVDFDNAKNVFIEGDNLEVLKLLQKAYNDKVKLIYIDPPYNTGNDFVYNDDYSDGLRGYLEYTGQTDDEGMRTSAAADTAGRRNSKWLSMLYPRLVLGRNLLPANGLMAISIDDWELPNLLSICREVFGQSNVVNVVAVKSSEASGVKMSHVDRRLPKIKEYVVLCARNSEELRLTPIEIPKGGSGAAGLEKYLKYYGKFIVNPEEPVDQWDIRSIKEYLSSNGEEPTPERIQEFQLENADRVIYRTNNSSLADLTFETATAEVTSATGLRYIWWEGKQMLFLADHLKESLCDLWSDISTINLNKETLGVRGFKNGQKPLGLIDRLMRLLSLSSDDVVMDFFAGSGTTGHAVLARHSDVDGGPTFVLVQLPEPVDPTKPEQRDAADFCDEIGEPRLISSIARERLRRAGESLGSGDGLRCLSLRESNFNDHDPSADIESLLQESSLVSKDTSLESLAAEILINEGVPLNASWQRLTAGSSDVVLAGGVAVALGLEVDDLAVTQVFSFEPRVAIFLEDGFASRDAVKANAFTRARELGITMKTV